MRKNTELSMDERNLYKGIYGLGCETERLFKTLEPLSEIPKNSVEDDIDFKERVRKFEIYLIKYALGKAGGNQAQAAKILKINHGTLHDKIKRYKISPAAKKEEKAVLRERDIWRQNGKISFDSNKMRRSFDIVKNPTYRERIELQGFEQRLNVLKNTALVLIEEIKAIQVFRSANMRNGINLSNELRRIEIHLIKSALKKTFGNQTKAARLLGLKLTTLNNKIKRLKILPEP